MRSAQRVGDARLGAISERMGVDKGTGLDIANSRFVISILYFYFLLLGQEEVP
jgi:hypothetical protein